MEFVSGRAFFRGSPVSKNPMTSKGLKITNLELRIWPWLVREVLSRRRTSFFWGENFSRPFQSPYQSVLKITSETQVVYIASMKPTILSFGFRNAGSPRGWESGFASRLFGK